MRQLQERYQVLKSPQRWLLTGLLSAVMIYTYQGMVRKPYQRQLSQLKATLSVKTKQNDHLEKWLGLEKSNHIYDTQLISPGQMVPMLHKLFGQTKGLKLISMKNLPPIVLGEKALKKVKSRKKRSLKKRPTSSDKHPKILQLLNVKLQAHDVVMSFEGNYAAVYGYLQKIDHMQLPILWQKMRYETVDYPLARVSVTVRSLSQEKDWLRA